MQIDKLTTTNAFVITDLDGASQSAGIARLAKKVLQGSTGAYARTATYLFAGRELQVGGAAAGISADVDERAEAIAAFFAEIAPRLSSGELILDAGSGLDAADVIEPAESQRSALRNELVDDVALPIHLDAVGAIAAAEAALGTLDGATAAVEGGPHTGHLYTQLVASGATVVEVDDLANVEASVLFCGSRQGMIDGAVAEAIDTKVVVPTGCQPISAKGLAVLRQRGIVALADFVTTSGGSYADWPVGETADEAIAAARSAIADAVGADLQHPDGPLLAACYRAEAFLSTWQETLPFGRPLA